ncbi:MAG: hypothetical protein JSR67_06875 [Proteobacteria bacterium]|nr:hypothetical protein [Pseudomonadota bacterium]
MQVAAADLKFVETRELRIVYYDPAESWLVPRVTQSMLSALAAQRRLLDYTPDGQVNVFLSDYTDLTNASTMTTPRNRVTFEVAAAGIPYETFNSGERFAALSVHESTHLADTERASPEDQRFRRLFHGKVDVDSTHPETLLYSYLTTPRNTAPRWYQEGSAVFVETWLMGGVGRAQGGYDEMVFRAMVHDHAKFYDPLGLVSKGTEIDFQTGANAYLYGTRFADYLALTYGPQRLLDWWRRDAASRRYYADQFEQVFGRPLDVAWQQWVDFEHSFQEQNLRSVHEHPVTGYHDLTKRSLGAVSRAYLSADGAHLFAAIRYPGQVAHIVSISRNDGRIRELAEVTDPRGYVVSYLAYDPRSGTLFYTTNNTNYRNLMALDLQTGKSRLLLKDARIGDIVFNPVDRSLWGLRLTRGRVQMVRIPYPYTTWKGIYLFPPGEVASDLDLSPDGKLAAFSVAGPGPRPGAPRVRQMRVVQTATLEQGDGSPLHALTMGAAVPESFVFSRDGRYLYGSSYYTGVSNIYRYEIATEKLEAVSNAEIGFFRPLPLPDPSKLIVLRYAATGFEPAEIEVHPTEDLSAINFLGQQVAEKHPEVTHWSAQNPDTVPYESQIVRQGRYQRAKVSLDSLYPVVEGFQDSVALGAHASFSDPIGFDSLDVDSSYSPDHVLAAKNRLHVSMNARHRGWTAGVAWNGADFYDLFGPTKRALTGYNGYLGYDRYFTFDPPYTFKFTSRVAYYGGLDSLPGFQNVPSPSKNLFKADAGFVSVDARRSPGAVDDETGNRWSIKAHAYGAAGALIPSLTATLDLGFPLPLDHSSIWLRTGASISGGSPGNPLANAYLGAFGNNYVDNEINGGAQRYRQLLSMPGFSLDALSGKSLIKGVLEWCLPPLRFEGVGSPGFYLSWARPELFFSDLQANLGTSGRRYSARDVGGQVDFQLHVMHRQPMMLSLGAARGFAGGGLAKTEFMLSLQVL